MLFSRFYKEITKGFLKKTWAWQNSQIPQGIYKWIPEGNLGISKLLTFYEEIERNPKEICAVKNQQNPLILSRNHKGSPKANLDRQIGYLGAVG